MHAVAEEHLAELDHLEQADTHDGRFCVVPPPKAGDEAGGDGDDVFKGAAEGDAGDVGDNLHVEVRTVEEHFEEVVIDRWEVGWGDDKSDFGGFTAGVFVLVDGCEVELGGRWGMTFGRSRLWCGVLTGIAAVHGWGVVGDCCFGELFLGDFVGDVGAGKGTAVDSEFFANGFGEEADVFAVDRDAFYAGDTAGIGKDVTFHLIAQATNELVGKVEDKDGGVVDGVLDGRVGDDVGREGDSRKVLDILMEVIDESCELVGLGRELGSGVVVFRCCRNRELFLIHPHLHFLLKVIGVFFCILSNDLSNGGAPSLRRQRRKGSCSDYA